MTSKGLCTFMSCGTWSPQMADQSDLVCASTTTRAKIGMHPLHHLIFLLLIARAAVTAIPEGRRRWTHGLSSSRRHGTADSSTNIPKGLGYSHIACLPKRSLAIRDQAEDLRMTPTMNFEECSEFCYKSVYFALTPENKCQSCSLLKTCTQWCMYQMAG